MFCSKCGKEIQDDVNFCSHCGFSIKGTNDFNDLPLALRADLIINNVVFQFPQDSEIAD